MFYTAIIAIRNYIIFDLFHVQWYNSVLCMDLWNVNNDDDDDCIACSSLFHIGVYF
jgi:hypothetical protein